jgi:RNA-directed DNA polymerase
VELSFRGFSLVLDAAPWISRQYPQVTFERYADDAIVHCRTEAQAQEVRAAIAARMRECGLELHPEKTKFVYCKDDNRWRTYPNEKFDFLGYTFRPRRSKNRKEIYFISFSPAVSDKAVKAILASSSHLNAGCRSVRKQAPPKLLASSRNSSTLLTTT